MGGMIYFAIELAYKGDSHFSMYLVGGLSFVLIGAKSMTNHDSVANDTVITEQEEINNGVGFVENLFR